VANKVEFPSSIVQLILIEAANTEDETATATGSSRIPHKASGSVSVTEPTDHDAAALLILI